MLPCFNVQHHWYLQICEQRMWMKQMGRTYFLQLSWGNTLHVFNNNNDKIYKQCQAGDKAHAQSTSFNTQSGIRSLNFQSSLLQR